MANNVVEVLRGVVGELKDMARSETIIGEPITVGDKTVIPVVKISVGFGAGGGQSEPSKGDTGFGGGGGGGAKIEPAAFIIMDKDGIRLLPAQKGKWEGVIESIPGIAKKIAKWKDKLKSEKGEGEAGQEDESERDEPEKADD
ncbi:MAG TPA: spore germination protein GerW family protein [Acidobacteriota bacterium]|nr:spore germination protein GerW family protein [Acidobacteriota bacterium]